jgi:imidazolonepropionase-like amidohydrolase
LSSAHAPKLDREIGTVQVGKPANLPLVRADPRKTIQAYQEIAKVIPGGRALTSTRAVSAKYLLIRFSARDSGRVRFDA